jgi:hypothetical protein
MAHVHAMLPTVLLEAARLMVQHVLHVLADTVWVTTLVHNVLIRVSQEMVLVLVLLDVLNAQLVVLHVLLVVQVMDLMSTILHAVNVKTVHKEVVKLLVAAAAVAQFVQQMVQYVAHAAQTMDLWIILVSYAQTAALLQEINLNAVAHKRVVHLAT